VQDAENNKLDRDVFNEAYLMHTSTSPQYSIIASCDVAAAMMEEPGGTALVEESIAEALDFRRAMRKVDKEWGADWWFQVWGPKDLSEEGIEEREAWMLKPGERWHGFGKLAKGFNLLDPIKATIITPGLDVDGDFSDDFGIPAAIVTKYLAEHGVIVEKCGLYSFFIMFTIGITKGRWNTLVTALQQFKDDYDRNHPLWKVLPEFVAKHPRYERVGLKDLCTQIHDVYKEERRRPPDHRRCICPTWCRRCARPTPSPRWPTARSTACRIDELEGRVTAVLLTPYPPGIPLLIPGEQFQCHHRPLPEVRPRVQRKVPRLRDRHPRPGQGRQQRRGALLRGLRGAVGATFPAHRTQVLHRFGDRDGHCRVVGADFWSLHAFAPGVGCALPDHTRERGQPCPAEPSPCTASCARRPSASTAPSSIPMRWPSGCRRTALPARCGTSMRASAAATGCPSPTSPPAIRMPSVASTWSWCLSSASGIPTASTIPTCRA
jgi:hypothetical protein